MWIRQLDIENFRGIKNAQVNFGERRNKCSSGLTALARARSWKLSHCCLEETDLFEH